MQRPRIAVSFSGGRSSAVMAKMLIEQFDTTHDLSFVFANTGCEHDDTLRFVDDVDRYFLGGRLVWVEGAFHEQGKGPTATVVQFETASRNGEPFEAAIAKHGVFNAAFPQCTSRLKTEVMTSYRRAIGWRTGSYETAIGIRADEADRMSAKRKELRLIYPLVSAGWTKRDVNKYMAKFEWDLKLPSDAFGNCVWCWKKSKRKLMTVAKHSPEAFAFAERMEKKYGHIHKGKTSQLEKRVFFRGKKSATDIVREAQQSNFVEYQDDDFAQQLLFDEELDIGSGCGDSCEPFADDT
jgi:hypothetical protein